jgi:uncharacterized glyoxalase superfamily protein PhnB
MHQGTIAAELGNQCFSGKMGQVTDEADTQEVKTFFAFV